MRKQYSFILESDENRNNYSPYTYKNALAHAGIGSGVGALAGGLISGSYNKRKKKSFWKGAGKGALIGAAVGGGLGAGGGYGINSIKRKIYNDKWEKANAEKEQKLRDLEMRGQYVDQQLANMSKAMREEESQRRYAALDAEREEWYQRKREELERIGRRLDATESIINSVAPSILEKNFRDIDEKPKKLNQGF